MRKPNPASQAAQRGYLIAAARRCFARAGFDGTSTEAVRIEAATSTGKLFHYFPNKKALILAVVEEHHRQTLSWLETLEKKADVGQALRDLLAGVIAAAADPLERRLVLEIAAAASRDASIANLSAETDMAMMQTIAALIRRHEKPFLLPSERMAALLSTWIDGVFSRAGSDPGFDLPAMKITIDELLVILAGQQEGRNHA
ncbi:TetR/AcrR family transcriptional regulator [Sphingomonadaceae bacterium jetA1]|jgi:AcrR family transcriptional regulator|uniref:TetR/AcrR family transcriptional regulator n=1 Tax=Facivitalis istanbulensis TaxID=3075838 RepID=UPI003492FDC2